MRSDAPPMTRRPLSPRFPLSVPVLLVHGAEDHLVPVWLGEELARELPMAQMVVVPGARHALMSDAPGTVDLLLAAYLARLELTLAEGG